MNQSIDSFPQIQSHDGRSASTMKAVYLNEKTGTEKLILGKITKPGPGAGEVLVKVFAAAITPTELQWMPTFTARSGQPRAFPVVLGHEFSGVIAAVGAKVNDFEPGDAVFGLNDWFINGAQAEYCVAAASAIAQKPRTIDHAQAAVVPISALTAWQALMVRSRLRHGQTVLIHGAAGSVGLFAVQLAHGCGARVIATASPINHDLVRSLGADQVIDYRTTPFEQMVREVDVIFDTVGGDTLNRSWSVLKRGGSLVTIAAQSEGETDERNRKAFMLVEADYAQLTAIGSVIEAGRVRVFVAAEFPLTQARKAYASAARGGGCGKTVLRVTT